MFKINISDLKEVEIAFENKDYEAALEKIGEIETRVGVIGPHLLWIRGVCLDMLGDHIAALKCIRSGLAMDGTYYNLGASWDVVLSNVRSQLASIENDNVDISFFKEVHDYIIEVGAMTSGLQYALLRNYLIRNAFDEFDPMLRNGLERNPNSPELLELQQLRTPSLKLAQMS